MWLFIFPQSGDFCIFVALKIKKSPLYNSHCGFFVLVTQVQKIAPEKSTDSIIQGQLQHMFVE